MWANNTSTACHDSHCSQLSFWLHFSWFASRFSPCPVCVRVLRSVRVHFTFAAATCVLSHTPHMLLFQQFENNTVQLCATAAEAWHRLIHKTQMVGIQFTQRRTTRRTWSSAVCACVCVRVCVFACALSSQTSRASNSVFVFIVCVAHFENVSNSVLSYRKRRRAKTYNCERVRDVFDMFACVFLSLGRGDCLRRFFFVKVCGCNCVETRTNVFELPLNLAAWNSQIDVIVFVWPIRLCVLHCVLA